LAAHSLHDLLIAGLGMTIIFVSRNSLITKSNTVLGASNNWINYSSENAFNWYYKENSDTYKIYLYKPLLQNYLTHSFTTCQNYETAKSNEDITSEMFS
jgi:hypothetical protein